ncbi:hypothetical protein ACUY4R_000429 [Kosakonia sp. BK9b]
MTGKKRNQERVNRKWERSRNRARITINRTAGQLNQLWWDDDLPWIGAAIDLID